MSFGTTEVAGTQAAKDLRERKGAYGGPFYQKTAMRNGLQYGVLWSGEWDVQTLRYSRDYLRAGMRFGLSTVVARVPAEAEPGSVQVGPRQHQYEVSVVVTPEGQQDPAAVSMMLRKLADVIDRERKPA